MPTRRGKKPLTSVTDLHRTSRKKSDVWHLRSMSNTAARTVTTLTIGSSPKGRSWARA